MVNRRMGNRSITSLRSRRRQTTVSHSRAGLNTDSRNPCRTASRSNTDNRNLMDSLSRRCRSMFSRGRCRTVSPPCPSPPRLNRRFHSLRCHNMPNRNNTVSRNRQCPATFLPSKPAPRPKISRRSPLSSARWPQSSSSRWQRCSSLRIASAVPITRKRWSKRRRWKAAIQPSMRNSARRRAQRTTIHPPLMTRARRS